MCIYIYTIYSYIGVVAAIADWLLLLVAAIAKLCCCWFLLLPVAGVAGCCCCWLLPFYGCSSTIATPAALICCIIADCNVFAFATFVTIAIDTALATLVAATDAHALLALVAVAAAVVVAVAVAVNIEDNNIN